MPQRIIQLLTPLFFESLGLTIFNIGFLVMLPNLLSIISFIGSMLLVVSRGKRFLEKNHEGSIKNWWIWFIKKN